VRTYYEIELCLTLLTVKISLSIWIKICVLTRPRFEHAMSQANAVYFELSSAHQFPVKVLNIFFRFCTTEIGSELTDPEKIGHSDYQWRKNAAACTLSL